MKLPAFGKSLMANRIAGYHPTQINLIYGVRWDPASETIRREHALVERMGGQVRPYSRGWLAECGWPTLAIRPAEYQRGHYDWRVCAGCLVSIDDQVGGLGDAKFLPGATSFDALSVAHWGPLYDLLGELVLAGAAPMVLSDGTFHFADNLAYNARGFSKSLGIVWPSWWSEAMQGRCERAFAAWSSDVDNLTANEHAK